MNKFFKMISVASVAIILSACTGGTGLDKRIENSPDHDFSAVFDKDYRQWRVELFCKSSGKTNNCVEKLMTCFADLDFHDNCEENVLAMYREGYIVRDAVTELYYANARGVDPVFQDGEVFKQDTNDWIPFKGDLSDWVIDNGIMTFEEVHNPIYWLRSGPQSGKLLGEGYRDVSHHQDLFTVEELENMGIRSNTLDWAGDKVDGNDAVPEVVTLLNSIDLSKVDKFGREEALPYIRQLGSIYDKWYEASYGTPTVTTNNNQFGESTQESGGAYVEERMKMQSDPYGTANEMNTKYPDHFAMAVRETCQYDFKFKAGSEEKAQCVEFTMSCLKNPGEAADCNDLIEEVVGQSRYFSYDNDQVAKWVKSGRPLDF